MCLKENHCQNLTLKIRNLDDCLILTIYIFENVTAMHILLNFRDRIASNEFNRRNCIQLDSKHTFIFFFFYLFASLWPLLYSKPYELGLFGLKDGSRKNLMKTIRYKPIIWVLVPVWPPSPTWRIPNLLNMT